MVMSLDQEIDFWKKNVTLFERGLESGRLKNNYFHISGNFGEIFKAHLMTGLVTWRIGQDDPSPYMKAAVDSTKKALAELHKMDPATNPVPRLRIHKSLIVASLIGVEHPDVDTSVFDREVLLDAEIGRVLLGKNDIGRLKEQTAKFTESRTSKLVRQTYDMYLQLLLETNQVKIADLVKEGEKLFSKRLKDSYYSNCDMTEGGGDANNSTIDFRLGAILKKIGYDGPSIHRWKWWQRK